MIYLDTLLNQYRLFKGIGQRDAENVYFHYESVAKEQGYPLAVVPEEACFRTLEYFAEAYESKQLDLFRWRER